MGNKGNFLDWASERRNYSKYAGKIGAGCRFTSMPDAAAAAAAATAPGRRRFIFILICTVWLVLAGGRVVLIRPIAL
jgi:hypothetical protein